MAGAFFVSVNPKKQLQFPKRIAPEFQSINPSSKEFHASTHNSFRGLIVNDMADIASVVGDVLFALT